MPRTARWELVAEALRQSVRSGEGLIVDPDGTRRLPSYANLLKRQWPGVGGTGKVSYGTLRQAIWMLRAEGWLHEGDVGLSGVRVREDHPD